MSLVHALANLVCMPTKQNTKWQLILFYPALFVDVEKQKQKMSTEEKSTASTEDKNGTRKT